MMSGEHRELYPCDVRYSQSRLRTVETSAYRYFRVFRQSRSRRIGYGPADDERASLDISAAELVLLRVIRDGNLGRIPQSTARSLGAMDYERIQCHGLFVRGTQLCYESSRPHCSSRRIQRRNLFR
jgi:hypothetical protein